MLFASFTAQQALARECAVVLMADALSVLRCTIRFLTGTMTIAGMPSRAQRAFRFFWLFQGPKAALCLTDFEVIQRI